MEKFLLNMEDNGNNLMGDNIEELERRYQMLLDDFRARKIDETTFIAEVDKLQFADEWGRYWMLGSESGAWHYYDGSAWHQADPRERDKLPFIDEQGRYWQKGAKSNDWYYFQPETNEWVKPGQDDPREPASAQTRQWQPASGSAASQPAYGYGQQQNVAASSASSEQYDTQLFQDDEGRYWTVGTKTGQWYFYDENGWHPAHEFQAGPMPQMPQSPPYQPQMPYGAASYYPPYQTMPPAQGYPAQPQQPIYQQPAQNVQAPAEPAAQPTSTESDTGETPSPPKGASQSGTWYYHDGNQWLKYSTGEPADEPPPDPTKILDQDGKEATIKVEEKGESVVAEFFAENEPPIEVVDVEVITVIEAEPDSEPEPQDRATSRPSKEPTSPISPMGDEVRPRRSRPTPAEASPAQYETPSEAQVQPAKRTPSDTGHPVKPRKRATSHEPTIIIPTGATASGVSSPSSTRSRMPTRPLQPERRRVPEDMKMEPVPSDARLESMPVSGRHRQVTQPLPVVKNVSSPPAEAVRRARQPTRENVIPTTPAPATTQLPQQAEPQQERPTFGDVLRTLPGTLWVWAAGTAVLLIAAILIVIVAMNVGDLFGISSVASGQSPTPTLDVSLAIDFTPTPGLTPTIAPELLPTPAPVTMIPFSSPSLGISLEYPEVWYREEDTNEVIFSPSTEGLNPSKWQDISLRVGMPANENSSIPDLLASALALFPAEAERINEGTISIASQTWSSTQIKFDDKNLGGQGISTIAVTIKDGVGHYLVAVAPAEEWNSVQPMFQEIIDSFRFGVEDQTAQATADTISPLAQEATDTGATSDEAVLATSTPELEPTPEAASGLDPVVHIVQSGDTLLAIANQYGVDVVLLASENGITDPGSLRVDQELTIPFTEEQLVEYYKNGGTSAATTSTSSGETTESVTADTTDAGSAETSAETEAAPEEAAPPPSDAPPLSGRIIYPAYNPGTSTYDLWIANVATGEQSGFMGNASQPSFNRDGRLLAYRSWDLGTRGIFFQDFVGGRGGKVTNFVEDGMPAWSPDGFTFVFASRKEGDRVPRLYIGNQLGEDTIGLSFQGEYPSILPDGRIIAKGCTPSGDCGIFSMGPRGGGENKISGEASDTAPTPSPDGSKIAFMSNGRGATNWEIWLMNVDGTNPQRLTDNKNNDGLPTWSPDGQSIAYVSDQGGVWGIWVMNADGSNQRKLVDMKGSPDGVVLYDEPNSRGWLEERISWAP